MGLVSVLGLLFVALPLRRGTSGFLAGTAGCATCCGVAAAGVALVLLAGVGFAAGVAAVAGAVTGLLAIGLCCGVAAATGSLTGAPVFTAELIAFAAGVAAVAAVAFAGPVAAAVLLALPWRERVLGVGVAAAAAVREAAVAAAAAAALAAPCARLCAADSAAVIGWGVLAGAPPGLTADTGCCWGFTGPPAPILLCLDCIPAAAAAALTLRVCARVGGVMVAVLTVARCCSRVGGVAEAARCCARVGGVTEAITGRCCTREGVTEARCCVREGGVADAARCCARVGGVVTGGVVPLDAGLL